MDMTWSFLFKMPRKSRARRKPSLSARMVQMRVEQDRVSKMQRKAEMEGKKVLCAVLYPGEDWRLKIAVESNIPNVKRSPL